MDVRHVKSSQWVAVMGCLSFAWAQAQSPAASQTMTAAIASQAAKSVSADYVIGPGDTLEIFVWRNAELTRTVPVRLDGKISTPLVEDMTAVGKTPSQLARDIEKVLAVYVKSPEVNVIVTVPHSVFSQVKVIGQVKTPAPLPYWDGMRVLDAVLAVGGLTAFAAGDRARLVRTDNGKETEVHIKLDKLMNRGDLSQNLPLRPGDVLVVPESRF